MNLNGSNKCPLLPYILYKFLGHAFQKFVIMQCLTDLTNSILTNHPGLTNRCFLIHKNFEFNEFPGLTNN